MTNPNLFLTRVFSISVILILSAGALAQNKERPKLKDFGSSLKRIKWDDEKKAAVDVKPNSTAKPESEEIDVVKVETSLVTCDVLVMDAGGNFVNGLTDKDFVVAEDGTAQKVGMFSLGDNVSVPRSIVLIIDYSGSQLPFIKTSVTAAKLLVDKLAPADSMAIVTDDVELIQDFTGDKHKLKSKLDSLLSRSAPDVRVGELTLTRRRVGLSKQYSALFATLREAFNAGDQRPIVIFQTDGDQLRSLRNSPLPYQEAPPGLVDKKAAESARAMYEASRTNFSLDDIYRAAEKARTTVYTVISGHQLLGRPLDEVIADTRLGVQKMMNQFPVQSAASKKLFDASMSEEQIRLAAEGRLKMQAALASVATSTGGWTMFLEKPEDADHIYSSIFSDMNRRYLVGYYPTNKEHDGKRRKLDVTVRDHPDYVVLGRRWYYAPAPDQ